MATKSTGEWKSVVSFRGGGRGLLPTIERDLDLSSVERFESKRGRAILASLDQLPEKSLSNVSAGVEAVLFVEGAPAAAGIAEVLGARAQAVRVALPERGEHAGLVPDEGRVALGEHTFHLHRFAGAVAVSKARLAAGPKFGESDDTIAERGKWFATREGKR